MSAPKIVTDHVYPPIPIRSFDWAAWVEGSDEETRTQGTGATEVAAVIDLRGKLDDGFSLSRAALITVDGGEGSIDMTFGDFLEANADGIDDSEAELIAITLAEGMTYQGGGGAEGRWTAKLALPF